MALILLNGSEFSLAGYIGMIIHDLDTYHHMYDAVANSFSSV